MARKLKSDRILFLATLLLLGLSLVMIYSASAVMAEERYAQPYFFLTKQVMWVVIGMALLWAGMRVDYRHYREPVFIWSALGFATLALVAVLFSPERNNARRWFSIGGLGIQPSELAKLTAIFFTAALLERRRHRINEVRYALAPIALVLPLLIGLILVEPDFGTSASVALIAGSDGLRRRPELRLHRRAAAAGRSGGRLPGLCEPVPLGAADRPFSTRGPTRSAAASRSFSPSSPSAPAASTGLGFMRGIQKLFYLPEATPTSSTPSSPRSWGSSARRSCSCASASLPGGGCAWRCARPTRSGRFSPSA